MTWRSFLVDDCRVISHLVCVSMLLVCCALFVVQSFFFLFLLGFVCRPVRLIFVSLKLHRSEDHNNGEMNSRFVHCVSLYCPMDITHKQTPCSSHTSGVGPSFLFFKSLSCITPGLSIATTKTKQQQHSNQLALPPTTTNHHQRNEQQQQH